MKDEIPPSAANTTRRDLLIGSVCFAGTALGASAPLWSTPHALPPGGLEALVPKRLGSWSLATTEGVLVAEGGSLRRGPYDDLLTRIYRSPTEPPVTLLIAYIGSQRADVRLHRPEACYPAAGFTLSDRRIERLKLRGSPEIRTQMLLARSAGRTERLVYWTRVGEAFPTSNVAQLGAFVRSNLMGVVPDAALVRLSVPGSDRTRAQVTIEAFLSALLAGSRPALSQVLLGSEVSGSTRSGRPEVQKAPARTG